MENKPQILHILVVGFHHKLGCQVEFSYPPLLGTSGKSGECPSGWKYLPTLALPDGSHNFVADTVFFNLPSLLEPTESVYGVSCFRQIPVEQLKIRTADVTRSTVQKSVCILARLPIYGYIEVKLSLIADAFFESGDFSCTDILVKAYQQLNACLLDDESHRPLRHFFVGLSLRELVLQWRQKTLQLFKLFLLQRRVVCFGSPVRGMCVLILGISSLIPRLLEKGFQEVACVRTSRPLSPMPNYALSGDSPSNPNSPVKTNNEEEDNKQDTTDNKICIPETLCKDNVSDDSSSPQSEKSELPHLDPTSDAGSCGDSSSSFSSSKKTDQNASLTRESSVDAIPSTLVTLASVNPDEYRAPISIFTSGNLCLPYISLPYMDLLGDPSVLSYVIGTSNVLFQTKRNLADVLIDIENANIEVHDAELRRQLVLTTEDLRFMDYLLRHVQSPKEDAEGSEGWIRAQFQGYILAMIRTAVLAESPDSSAKDADHFNGHFMNAFQKTQCYQEWFDVRPDNFFELLPAGHPFAGTLSVADMKLKLAQTMHNSESGRKINQAVNNTSKAVGGAITQAKGAFSNWWSSMTVPTPQAGVNINKVNTPITTSDQSQEDQTQEISVAFQNNCSSDEVAIDIGITHSDSSKGSMDDQAATKSIDEKCIDSAEELQEEVDDGDDVDSAELPENISSRAEMSSCSVGGIVEIGREADILNNDKPLNNLSDPDIPTPNNGRIFIV